jgi:twitching motility protein PilT
MQTLNQCLYSLYTRRLITLEEAMGRSNEVDELRNMIEGRSPTGAGPGGVQGPPPRG